MTTIQSQGTSLTVGDGASPEVFNAVGQIVNIDGPTGSAPVIDVSNLASTAREKNMGLPDEGQITLSLQYDPDDTGQTRLKTLRTNRTAGNFKINMSDSPATVLSFSGYVLEFSRSFNIDEVVMGSATIEIDGAVTEA
jgi:hypothetical protein